MDMKEIDALFKGMCANCGSDIYSSELQSTGLCKNCLKGFRPNDAKNSAKDLYLFLKNTNRLKDLRDYFEVELRYEEFEKFFEKVVGNKPWSAQKSWAKRMLKRESFSIVAPTGVGKTTFGIAISLFLTHKKIINKVYFILPTTTLVNQVYAKFINYCEKARINSVKIIRYSGSLRQKEKREIKKMIKEGDFNILITTTQLLSKSYSELFSNKKFDLIFVDDVDAVLKSSKNIDKILQLLGFCEDDIKLGMKSINYKLMLGSIKSEEKRNKIMKKIEEIKNKLKDSRKRSGVLILSSATGKARGKRVKLFRELLGFEIGGGGEGIRNIIDLYDLNPSPEKLLEIIKKVGVRGGLIFVAKDLGIEFTEKLKTYLRKEGIKCETLHAEHKEKYDIIRKFREGEIDILIGVSHFYGTLTRGIDLPEVVRYAIFYEIPRFKVNVSKAINNLYFLLSISNSLLKVLKNEELESTVKEIRKDMLNMSPALLKLINKYLSSEGGITLPPNLLKFVEKVKKLSKIILEIFSSEETIKKLEEYPYISIKREGDSVYVFLVDLATYIQASGRTSRMYMGGLTKGLSIVLSSDKKLVNSLEKKLRWRFYGTSIKSLNEVNLEKIVEEIDKDREKVKLVREGKFEALEKREPIKTILFIVESPNKARTIANFFGRPARRRIGNLNVYEISTGNFVLLITSTVGHIFELVERESKINNYYGIVVGKNSFIPIYGTIKKLENERQVASDEIVESLGLKVISDKREIVESLRELAYEVDTILIATDPDYEGEKIAWDIYNVLKFFNKNIKRAEFHEVTLPAIINSIKNPRDVNTSWVKAQIVRRIEDRWLGFLLSEFLQKVFNKKTLSAGRVQTPVLGWIIEKYNEYKRNLFYRVFIETERGIRIHFDLEKSTLREVKKIVENISNGEIVFRKVEEKEETIDPLPPYDTEMLIHDASVNLRFSSTKTMRLAQNLFEFGFITYHRTDSTRVSNQGIEIAREFLSKEFGMEDEFYPKRWGEGGAHECIRPVRAIDRNDIIEILEERNLTGSITEDHLNLYDLIVRRFVASQMKPTKVKIAKFVATIENLKGEIEGIISFPKKSFLSIYKPFHLEFLPDVLRDVDEVRDKIKRILVKKVSKVHLYSDGTIISEMKRRGIGRPSTYAIIIKKLRDRYYVLPRKFHLIPTPRGIAVYEILEEFFGEYVSEERTRILEEKMKMVENGEVEFKDVVEELYEEVTRIPLESIMEKASEKVEEYLNKRSRGKKFVN